MSATGNDERLIYLDHAASTPMRPEAIEAMMPYLSDRFANPNGSHRFARRARAALDDARDVVAGVVGCRPGEVVFTSGGTEADNTALRGGRSLCSAAEHHAVLHAVERDGGVVIGVDRSGRVVADEVASAMRHAAAVGSPVRVVSVMAVNNEVGSISDVAAVAAAARSVAGDVVVHSDAVQTACWLDLRDLWPCVDLMSLSAHKFGGPKGIGALVVRDGTTVSPMLVGGGQEREVRSGTQNVAGAVAMAEALRLTDLERPDEVVRIAALRDRFVDGLIEALDTGDREGHREGRRAGTGDGACETVDRAHKVAGSAHVCLADIENEALLYLLDEGGVCASAASACAAGAMEPSHVLAAMGVERRWSSGAVRFSLGRTTTDDDIDRALDVVITAVRRIRSFAARA
jgi:cysteine desulfurase